MHAVGPVAGQVAAVGDFGAAGRAERPGGLHRRPGRDGHLARHRPVWKWGSPRSWMSWVSGGPMMNSWSIGSALWITNRTVEPGLTVTRGPARTGCETAVIPIVFGPAARLSRVQADHRRAALRRPPPRTTPAGPPPCPVAARVAQPDGRRPAPRSPRAGFGRLDQRHAWLRRARVCRPQAARPAARAAPPTAAISTAAEEPESPSPAGPAGGRATAVGSGADWAAAASPATPR